MSRILALDFGTKRVGAALSDPDRSIATPLEVYERRSANLDTAHYRGIVADHGVGLLVVGLPAFNDGSEGGSAERARAWGRSLSEAAGVPVVFFDERYTTVEAEELMRSHGVKAARRKALIDMMAAQMLLQAYLDAGCPVDPAPPGALEDRRDRGPR
jgi:putative Holliday junction resolvase